MPSPWLEARLRFLHNSSRLLQSAAPSTSAHLMLERNIVAEQHERVLDQSQLKDICRACGTILIAHSTSKTEILDSPFAGRIAKRGGFAGRKSGTEKHECLACRRVTTRPVVKSQQKFEKERRPLNLGQPSKLVISPSKSDVTEAENSTPANASSKRRAKARKQGGLQAMLEKSKGSTSQSAGMSLDLMDFMKN